MMKSKMTDIDRLVTSLDSATKLADQYNKILSTIIDLESCYKTNRDNGEYWKGVRDTLDIIEKVIERKS